ncbi:MAG: hypothetical protein WBQ08_06940 [Candidatus Sulfotelmatobacter sp.]
MTNREQYAPDPASGAQFRRLWSAHVDALERYLDGMDQDRMDQDRMGQVRQDQSRRGQSTQYQAPPTKKED